MVDNWWGLAWIMYEQYAVRLCWVELMYMARSVCLDYQISKRDVPVSSVEAALIKLYYFHPKVVIPWWVRVIFIFLESCITEIKMAAIFMILESNMFNSKVPLFLCYSYNTMDFLNTASKIWISLTTKGALVKKWWILTIYFGQNQGKNAIKFLICNVIKE